MAEDRIAGARTANGTVATVLVAISVSHLLNDTIQSIIPAIYPLLKDSLALTYTQVGLITLTFQMTASLLQPAIGLYTDKRPKPFSLPVGMGFTLLGLLLLAWASNFAQVLAAAALVGMGSAIFHPESSRVARMASGGRYGLAQSVFQVGGNVGSAIGPLLAAFIVLPGGQSRIAWFSLLALAAIVVLANVGAWYKRTSAVAGPRTGKAVSDGHSLPARTVRRALAVLLLLTFSKFFYLACLTSYFTFFLIDKFGLSVQSSQVHLFIFLAAVALGTLIGGPLGDRIGRKYVIWFSILGMLPFSILLPDANLFWTGVLTVAIGLVMSSAFPSIVVFAQELLPGRVGMVSGIFFGVAFGMGGIGAAVLGVLADATSLEFVFRLCSFLPLIGLLTVFLPRLERRRA